MRKIITITLTFLFIVFLILLIMIQIFNFRKQSDFFEANEVYLNNSITYYFPFYSKGLFIENYLKNIKYDYKNNDSDFFVSFEFDDENIYVNINDEIYRKYSIVLY